MATSGQQVSLEQESPLFEVLAGVLSDWELNGYNSYIWDDDTISKLRDRVYTYSVRLDERVRKEREVMRLFLQQGKKYCKALFTATSVQASIPDDSEDIYSDGRVSPPPAYTPVEAVTLSATGPVQSDLVDSNRQVLCPIRLDPSSIDPYKVVIDGLAEDENPHAYVNRVHQLWLDLTGNDGSQSDTDRSFLRTKLESGLPHAVQKKLRDVVGLATMPLHAYREQIIHFVNQHRHKLMNDQAKAIDMVQHLSGQKSLLNDAKLADIAVAKQLALERPTYCPNPVPSQPQPSQTLPWRVRESPDPPQWVAPAQGQQATTMLPPPQAMPRHQWAPQPAQQSQQYTAPPERYANCHRCGLPGHFRRHCNQTFPAPRENKTVSTQGGDVMDIR